MTPNDFARTLGCAWHEANDELTSNFCGNAGYLRAALRNIRDPAFAICCLTAERDPCRLTATPANLLAVLLEP